MKFLENVFKRLSTTGTILTSLKHSIKILPFCNRSPPATPDYFFTGNPCKKKNSASSSRPSSCALFCSVSTRVAKWKKWLYKNTDDVTQIHFCPSVSSFLQFFFSAIIFFPHIFMHCAPHSIYQNVPAYGCS